MTIWKSGRMLDAIGTLPEADSLTGDEQIPVVQAGQARRTTVSHIRSSEPTNDIGTQGAIGFGVGVAPRIPDGFEPAADYAYKRSANRGLYYYSDGSRMRWIPAFFHRFGSPASPRYATYGLNAVDILPWYAFSSVAAANAAGFGLLRAFYDGGQIQPGVMVDEQMCSNNGGIASSLRNANPLSSHADHNPFSGLTGLAAGDNIYAGAFKAAKTRGPQFFPSMRYIRAALAILSVAHAQGATSSDACAWYAATGVTNFPKGCNNNALRDTNDASVLYTSDGYSNCGKTGSGAPYAKTTHNGQECGVADLNGNMWEVSPGLTCVASSVTITAATQANPVELTLAAPHGLATGGPAMITSIGGMTQINDRIYKVTVVDATHVTLDGCDGTGFSAFTAGGSLTNGAFYALKPSVAAKDVTGGASLATDHWGAAGRAAQFEAITLALATTHGANGFAQRFGSAANGVLSPDFSGNASLLAGLGLPIPGGLSAAGTNLFGADYYYQYFRDDMCPRSGAYWYDGSNAGVWALALNLARSHSNDNVGFRAACYL